MKRFVAFCVRMLGSILIPALLLLFPVPSKAQLVVDCTGATPGAFPLISSAISSSGLGTAIFVVAGPCNEDLQIFGATDLFIGTYTEQPNVALNGRISIADSHGVYFHGLNISSSSGSGITASSTRAIILDTCTSNNNAGFGLTLSGASEALIISPASFDGNASGGLNLSESSTVEMTSWGGQAIDISNNRGPGVYASFGSFNTYGHTNILNNSAGQGSLSGYGIDLRGGSRAQLGAITAPNVISGNQSGGISLQETAELSLWNGGSQSYVQNNGPVGISVGFGSQVTLFNDVEVSGHTGPALDLYANSQGYLFGANYLHNNGTSTDPRSAAIRVDGNSQVFLRGGTVSQNYGPAILALVNSSADLTGVSFAANTGGIISCDTSAYMVSDLIVGPLPSSGVLCRTPHNLGNRVFNKLAPVAPDWSALKALQAKYTKMATRK